MVDREPDELLVRRFLAGEQAAFASLVERHQGRVYNVCLRVLGDPEDARDATQDAFVSALRKLGQFRGDAAFSTWMHRIAINACYDAMRKRRRQPMLRLVADEGPDPDPGPPVSDHADEVAGAIDVASALLGVPEEFRVALVLADVQDMAYEEIARVLDVPVGTVKSRVHRGRVALARAMGVDRGDRGPSREPSERPRTSKESP